MKYLLIVLLITLFGCENKQRIDGYYSTCSDGEYLEVYFKKDSMRIASNNKRVKLSEWRKIKIENDTLYFETFGEWRYPSKASIKYIGFDNIQLQVVENEEKLNLNPIYKNLNFEKSEKFWNEFNNRQNSKNCK